MSVLEPPYGARDRGGMAARLEGIPAQIEEALERQAREPWKLPLATPDLLAVGAMGGSAMSADLARGLTLDRLPRPLLTVRQYRWPACVTRASLALLSSYSGDTEETVELFCEAGRLGIPRVALTTGGQLAAECAQYRVFAQRLPGGSPPRAALYASWVAVTGLLHALGWVDDPEPAWRVAIAELRSQEGRIGPASSEDRNPAKQMARALAGRFVLFYGGSERLEAVGTRMRTQLNENAKMLGHSAGVPELNHNEIVGWERPGALRGRAAVVLLRDVEDGAEVDARLRLTGEYVARQGGEVFEVRSSGDGRLARMASLVQFGDYLSFYLAMLNGADPTPIPSIDEFKRRLSQRGARRGT